MKVCDKEIVLTKSILDANNSWQTHLFLFPLLLQHTYYILDVTHRSVLWFTSWAHQVRWFLWSLQTASSSVSLFSVLYFSCDSCLKIQQLRLRRHRILWRPPQQTSKGSSRLTHEERRRWRTVLVLHLLLLHSLLWYHHHFWRLSSGNHWIFSVMNETTKGRREVSIPVDIFLEAPSSSPTLCLRWFEGKEFSSTSKCGICVTWFSRENESCILLSCGFIQEEG